MTEADRAFLTQHLTQCLKLSDAESDTARAVKLVVNALVRASCYDTPPDALVIHNREVLVRHHDYELDGERLRFKGRTLHEDDIIRVIRFDQPGPAERYYTAEEIAAWEA